MDGQCNDLLTLTSDEWRRQWLCDPEWNDVLYPLGLHLLRKFKVIPVFDTTTDSNKFCVLRSATMLVSVGLG